MPEGYFIETERRILDVVLAEGSLTELKSTSQSNQTVPEGYFESLPQIVLSKIKNESGNNEVPLISINSRGWNLKPMLQLAAAVAAFVILLYPVVNFKSASTPNVDVAIEQISNEELNSYFDENVVAITEDDVASHVSDKTLNKAAAEISSQNAIDESSIDLSQIDLSDIENL